MVTPRHQRHYAAGPTPSNGGVDDGSAAPVNGSIASVATLRSAEGLLDDLFSNDL
jgi:hypothetical protein